MTYFEATCFNLRKRESPVISMITGFLLFFRAGGNRRGNWFWENTGEHRPQKEPWGAWYAPETIRWRQGENTASEWKETPRPSAFAAADAAPKPPTASDRCSRRSQSLFECSAPRFSRWLRNALLLPGTAILSPAADNPAAVRSNTRHKRCKRSRYSLP